MQDVFITSIHIDKVRHLKNVDIELSATERKHLILTGKNGSGKTSLLEAIYNAHITEARGESGFFPDSGTEIIYSIPTMDFYPNMIFIETERVTKVAETNTPNEQEYYDDSNFLQYMINVNYWRLMAKENGNTEEIEKYNQWVIRVTNALREIYGTKDLTINGDKKHGLLIHLPNGQTVTFNQLSSGYKALFFIVMKIMGAMDSDNLAPKSEAKGHYDFFEVVLIDELETHLHVELQKRVLPFLTKMFPNVQFIVATHSPFVVTSLDNAVVFDLERAVELQLRGEDVDGGGVVLRVNRRSVQRVLAAADSQKSGALFERFFSNPPILSNVN
jgi:predicted ATP-binding protein involved in virulence